MAEIRQELGIDVSQAISALNNLDRRLDQFGRSLDNIAGKLRNFNTAASRAFRLGNVTGDLEKASTSTQKVVQGFSNFAREANNAGSAANSAASGINAAANASQNAANAANALGASAASGTTRASTSFTRLGSTINAAAARISGTLGRVRTAFQTFGTQSQQSIGQFTLGFSTLGRIISAQLFIRGINAIGSAFTEAASSAREFERTIAEITTIAEGSSFRNFDAAADAVRRLSDEFNVPLGDVGEGLYQTISNQIQGAANQVEVLTQALILSKTGVATAADSVSILTGTLNSFQLEATEAERVTAVLFKTVQLGRTRIDELANSFNVVSTLANETGVSVEELAAAFATVTINGLNTSKAATQLRGVLNAILKPTEELQAAFEAAGFAEGSLAVETIGLAGVIELISDAAGGSEAELAKLIPRIRGITAQLILGRDAGDQFQSSLDRIQRAAEEGIEEEFQLRIQTNAETVENAINRLSNALTVDLGRSINSVLAFFIRFQGATDLSVDALRVLGPALVLTAGAFATYAAAAGAAALAQTGFGAGAVRVLGFLRGYPAALAIAGALGVGTFQATQAASRRAADQIVDDVRRANADRIKEARSGRQAILREDIQRITDQFRAVSDFVRDERIKINERLKNWEDNNAKIKRSTESVFNDILDANRDFVDSLRNNADNAAQAQIDSQQRVADLRRNLEDTAFNASLQGRDPVAQSFLQQQRAANLARNAVEQLSTALREDQVSGATDAADRALAAAREAVETARTSGNRAAVSRALANQRDIVNDIIRAEQRQQQIQAQREATNRAAAQREEARVRELESAIEEILDIQDRFDPSASITDRQAIVDEFEAAFKEVRRLSVPDQSKLTADQLIDLASFRARIQDSFNVAEGQGFDLEATLSGESLRTLNEQIQKVASDAFESAIKEAISASLREGSTITADAISQFQEVAADAGPVQALDKLVQALNAERDRLIQIERNEENILRASENLKEAGETVAKQLDRSNSALENTATTLLTLPAALARGIENIIPGRETIGRADATAQLNQLEQQIRGLPQRSQFLQTEELQAELTEINQTFRGIVDNLGVDALLTLGPQIRRINEAVQTADEAIQRSIQQRTSLQENFQGVLEGLQQTGQAAEDATKGAADNAGDLSTNAGTAATSLNSSATSSAAIATNLERGAAAAAQIASSGGGGPVNAAFGKRIRYFNDGGFAPRGTDTVPAMLSPGEFVVNAKSTRKFFSQLQAINSGNAPHYMAEGGPVTSISIGDINVSASDTRSGDVTGRQIATSLKRELRRKTSAIRRF